MVVLLIANISAVTACFVDMIMSQLDRLKSIIIAHKIMRPKVP